ncbi:hypothetical protein [Rhizobium leguminosarum]|uniref:hypothetical protein n=1 Tax=Rhizobium leguminosarum TaxID=384 RepID=UPI001FE01813|nr:hypothetical protein [Rhizobium leguminosarum]
MKPMPSTFVAKGAGAYEASMGAGAGGWPRPSSISPACHQAAASSTRAAAPAA